MAHLGGFGLVLQNAIGIELRLSINASIDVHSFGRLALVPSHGK